MVHNRTKDFCCIECGYMSSTNGDLKKHIKQVHTQLRDNQCPDCKYKCSLKPTLILHMKTCTGLSNMSKMEQVISELLDELKIDYIYDENFMNLKSAKGGRLRFDFRIPSNSESYLFIEYDGAFHFKPIKGFQALANQMQNDRIKDNFCKENGFPLLRINIFNDKNLRTDIINFLKEFQY